MIRINDGRNKLQLARKQMVYWSLFIERSRYLWDNTDGFKILGKIIQQIDNY